MRYFVAVARLLSFTAAAKKIRVAQASLSETVKNLEEELGFELLSRTRQSVRLTAAGESFLRDAERILRDTDDASYAAGRIARGESGHLSIGFLGATDAPFLPKLLRTFHKTHPNVEMTIFDGTPGDVAKAMVDGRIDLAISHPNETVSQPIPLERFQIYSDDLCAALPRNHPLSAEKGPLPFRMLAKEPLIVSAREGAPWFFDTVIAACRRAKFVPRIVLAPNYLSTSMLLTEGGLGIGIVPSSAAHSVAGRALFFRVLTPRSDPVPKLLLWPRGLQSPPAAAFVDLVRVQAASIAGAMAFHIPGLTSARRSMDLPRSYGK
jgi:DNA-binding transcriptional LysR family regulator